MLKRQWFGRLRGAVVGRVRRAIRSPARWIFEQVETLASDRLVRLGTTYGGWTIHDDRSALDGRVALLGGAGEDLSFDVALNARYGCTLVVADPTPKAIVHVDGLLHAANGGHPYYINNANSAAYDFSGFQPDCLKFLPVAVWTEKTTLNFWVPEDPSHASHSAVNLQGTRSFIEVQALSIEEILNTAGFAVQDLKLLKLDIEGAEIPVINQMLNTSLRPQQLLLEFDEMQSPTRSAVGEIKGLILRLRREGYRLAHFDGHANCLFLRDPA